MEGTPGHREASLFTKRCGSWPWRLLHPPTRASAQQGGYSAARAQAREREDEKERRQGCQRLDCIGRRGNKTPTLVTGSRKVEGTRPSVFDVNPPKRFGRRETTDPPVMPRGALDSVGVHAVKAAERAGNKRVRVHANRSGGKRRLDASRVFCTGRSQGLVEQEGASREEARSTA
jgi:hypothetical protein